MIAVVRPFSVTGISRKEHITEAIIYPVLYIDDKHVVLRDDTGSPAWVRLGGCKVVDDWSK